MISICIPTYEQFGKGAVMLDRLFKSILIQTYKEYEVCVSDNSEDDVISSLCKMYKGAFKLKYIRNPIRGASANINSAMDMARYDNIKMMLQDDLFHKHIALEKFAAALKRRPWAISDSVHINEKGNTVHMKRVQYIHTQFEKNITGMTSVVGWKKNELRFLKEIPTLCDMYFYYQLYEKYGPQEFIRGFMIAQRFWPLSHSNNMQKTHDEDRKFLRENNLIKC